MCRYQGEPTSDKLGVSDNYKSVRWTPMNIHLLNTFYDTTPLSMQCNQSDGHKFPVRAGIFCAYETFACHKLIARLRVQSTWGGVNFRHEKNLYRRLLETGRQHKMLIVN